MRTFILSHADGTNYAKIRFELTKARRRQFSIQTTVRTSYVTGPERKAILELLDERLLVVVYFDDTSGLIVTPKHRQVLIRRRETDRLHKQRNGPWED